MTNHKQVLNMKTPQEIEDLKASWKRDPCWDIENTEGFEAHHDELLAFRKNHEAESERKAQERTQALKRKWYEIGLNELFQLDNYTTVQRVPGGWIYVETMCSKEPSSSQYDDAEYVMNSTFIPYSNEFQS